MHQVDDPTQVKHVDAAPQSVVEEGMVLQLADGRIVACNAAAEKILGLTTEQIRDWSATHSSWQAIHEDGNNFPLETHPAAIALLTGQPQFNVVMGLAQPDKEPIWVEIDAQPLFQTGSSTIYGAISTFRQISLSQFAEKQTQQKIGSDLAQLPDANAAGLSCCNQLASTCNNAIALFNFSIHLLATASSIVQNNAQREQVEESLRESQAQLQQQLAEIEAIYQSVPIGLNVLDTDLRFVRINQRLAEINGFSVEAHIGRTVRELLPGIADAAEQVLRPILATGEPLWNVEIQGETPAQPGVQRTWLEHFLPLKHGDRTIGISTVCEEITERKQTEAKIKDQQERLQAALFAAETGTFRWDIRTNALDWDENLDRLFGLPPGETARSLDAFIEMVHPDDRQAVIDRCQRCATVGADFDLDFRVVYANGTIRWLSDKGKTFFDEEGKPTYMTGACVDISDRKLAEAALRQSEEFKDRMLESSPDCIKLLDLDGRLLYMNSGGLCVMEIDDITPFLNAQWVCFWQGEDRQQAQQALAAANAGEVSIFRGYCPTAKGTPKWWEVIVSPILDASGQVEQILSISRDISDRKAIEAQREKLLQQEQAAREAAERANQIKDEFLAVLSHELRSPLNPILGWARLLQTGRLPAAKTAEALTIIERNARLQSQLIEDLLDMSRILRGKLTLNVAPVDLAATIKAALETVRLAAEAKNIQIQLSLLEVRPMMGDAGRLQQVIWNLLTNAIKFTPEFGRIEVRLASVESHAQIQVSDTGKGIAPKFLPYVFEHFRQEDSAITRKFGGLGLGLAIVRQIVEMHGGTVQADSPGEGQGATFTVNLPLPKQTLATPSQDSASVSIAQSAPLAGIRVLVVDDDDDSREFVAFVLEQAGAEVVPTASAIAALQILAQSQFDIVVSDIGMPQIDGYTFMRQIRARPIEAGGKIPAIALTAYAGDFNQQQALQAGFQDHISKPVEPDALVKAILHLCTSASS